MPRRGENIYKRKDGRWEGRYMKGRVDGKIKYGYVFANTYKEVKMKLASIICPNNHVLPESFAEQKNTADDCFSPVAKEWLISQKPQWKQSSIVKYTNILNLYVLPDFADKRMSEITRDDVVSFSNKLLLHGGLNGNGLAPKTVTSIISVMKNIFKYAVEIKGYTLADMNRISIKQPQKQIRILSLTEQLKLSEYLQTHLTPCNLGILLCLYTGLRVGEICALKWKDISFDEQYLYVHQTMQRLQIEDNKDTKTTVIISAPKSDCSIRQIPIPDNIFELLGKFKKQEKAFILTGTSKNYMEPRTMQNHFKSVLKHCNIADANFHALRHTFATRCVELGFDMKSLSEILGHASVNITLNRYVHPSMKLKQKNMNMLSELFSVK